MFLSINDIAGSPTLYPLSTFVHCAGLRVGGSGKMVKKGGLTLVDMVKSQPHGGALSRGRRGHRHQEGKGKVVGSSSSKTT